MSDSKTTISLNAQRPALVGNILNVTVLVTGLGYLVDMFDLFLFNMTRVVSLTELGYSGDALTDAGLMVVNGQVAGLLIGALFFGILGDKFGRKKCLFASILIYSLGSIATAFVQDSFTYALIRFITGIGLAGELGLGMTLIAEKMHAHKRGYGGMIFISLGFFGVLLAAVATEYMYWRHIYIMGGIAGLLLLFARSRLMESGMFENTSAQKQARGNLKLLLANPRNSIQFFAAILFILPVVFVSQIVFTLAPEHAKSFGIETPVPVHIVIAIGYISYIIGDFLSIGLSEHQKSRKQAGLIFLFLGMIVFAGYILFHPKDIVSFYIFNALVGLSVGIWMIGCVWAAEMFGTNIRATVASTVPNFARGMTLILNLAYAQLKYMGSVQAMTIIGVAVFALSYLAWRQLPETYGRDLDYHND